MIMLSFVHIIHVLNASAEALKVSGHLSFET